MPILIWVLLGLTAGLLASILIKDSGAGLAMDLVLGALGALLGGAAFHLVGRTAVTGFNVQSVLVALAASVVLLVAYHALTRRTHA